MQREIKAEAGQRQVAGKLDCLINCFGLLWNLWGTTEGFREEEFCHQSGVCARDRLVQRVEAVRLVRFIQVSYLGEQRECNSTQHVISPGV